jgi:DNA-binding transcriptional LysR family regulator
MGAALFSRTKRRVALTAAGAALLPEAQRLLRQAGQLREGVQRAARGEAGTLTLGFISVAAYNVLPELLPEFHRHHPGVKLALQEATTDVQLAALRQGDIDVGLVLPPVEDSSISYAPVFRDRLVAALPAHGSVGAGGAGRAKSIKLKSLAPEPFILFPRKVGPGLYDLITGFCRRAGFSPRIEQEAIQMQTIVSLVAAGMGVALVPASLQHLRRTGVVYKPLAEKSPAVEVGLAWRRDNESPAAAAFIALARKRYRLR